MDPVMAHGKICYLEISASDIQASAAFYKEVFNWEIRTRSSGGVGFDDAAGQVSGTFVMGRQPFNGIGLGLHIMVEDVSQTLKVIERNGGKCLPNMHDYGHETIRTFSDPGGNIFCIYQEASISNQRHNSAETQKHPS